MNDIFSAPRFGALLNKQLAEHYKGYLMALGLLAGAIALLVGMINALSGEPVTIDTQYAIFFIFYFAIGILFTSSIFSDMGNRKSATAVLTLPASHFEKFLVKWLLTYALYQVVYIAVFYMVMIPMLHAGNFHGKKPELMHLTINQKTVGLFLLYGLLHSTALLGAIYFRKLHFIKTGFIAFVATMVLTLLNNLFLQLVIGAQIRSSEPFGSLHIIQAGNEYTLAHEASSGTMISLCIAVTLLFWAAAYYRLKEKQV
jgi:hypothetical protein